MKTHLLTDITLTDTAKERIDEIKSDNKNIFIRIMVTTGGCAGHQYHILMDDYIGETDYVLNIENNQNNKNSNTIKQEYTYIVIDEASLEFLHNSTIEFENSLEFSGFKINNPNISATCSCGNSFTCSGDCIIEKKKDCQN